MGAQIENLTTNEAAIAAGVTVAKINRMIDKRILPKKLYKTSRNRTVRKDACLWIAFYFETEEVLTSAARVKAMRGALRAQPLMDGTSALQIRRIPDCTGPTVLDLGRRRPPPKPVEGCTADGG